MFTINTCVCGPPFNNNKLIFGSASLGYVYMYCNADWPNLECNFTGSYRPGSNSFKKNLSNKFKIY